MTSIGNRMKIGALTGLLFLGWSRSSVAQTENSAAVMTVQAGNIRLYRSKVPTAVPAAKREPRSFSRGRKGEWIPGFWDLQGNRHSAARAGWVWVPGRWLTRPEREARWEPAHWGLVDEWWSWIPGHWVVPGRYGYPPDLATGRIARLKESQESQE